MGNDPAAVVKAELPLGFSTTWSTNSF